MRIGVICPSEIAIRRFMPALQQCKALTFAGVGVYTKQERFAEEAISDEVFHDLREKETNKARAFTDQYGGVLYDGYEAISTSPIVDAMYLPLPPALHFKWAYTALEHGKHVLIEKPSTVSAADTRTLVELAEKKGLALHENYMFTFHEQLAVIDNLLKQGEIGDVRLYRISFGFPRRAANDFRYDKALGGGALLDAGGYVIRCATLLLGPTAEINYAQLNYIDGYSVDMYGSGAMVNADGVTAQLAFGMDNNYKCELEVWGSKGCLTTGRILTAPVGFTPTATIRKGNDETTFALPADDAFLKSIRYFVKCTQNESIRRESYATILKQAELVDAFQMKAGWHHV